METVGLEVPEAAARKREPWGHGGGLGEVLLMEMRKKRRISTLGLRNLQLFISINFRSLSMPGRKRERKGPLGCAFAGDVPVLGRGRHGMEISGKKGRSQVRRLCKAPIHGARGYEYATPMHSHDCAWPSCGSPHTKRMRFGTPLLRILLGTVSARRCRGLTREMHLWCVRNGTPCRDGMFQPNGALPHESAPTGHVSGSPWQRRGKTAPPSRIRPNGAPHG